MTPSKGTEMTEDDRDVLLNKIELAKLNLLELSAKALEIADNLETIHLELATADSRKNT